MTTRITFKEFAQQIGRVACKHRQKVIAIDGGGGAGKTTFASYLQQAIAGSTIVKIDDFYRPPQLRTPLFSTKIINPNFDWDRLRTSVLEAVKEDREIRYQLYDFKTGTLSGEIISIPSDVTIIVEGVWSLQEAFRGFYDYRIWLEVPSDIRMERGVARDGEEYRKVWEEEWIPIDESYKEIYKPHLRADCVIDSLHSDYTKDSIVLSEW
jgi:uridine kinase